MLLESLCLLKAHQPITASKRNLGSTFFIKDISMIENAFSVGIFR